jgi:hypothetical protein
MLIVLGSPPSYAEPFRRRDQEPKPRTGEKERFVCYNYFMRQAVLDPSQHAQSYQRAYSSFQSSKAFRWEWCGVWVYGRGIVDDVGVILSTSSNTKMHKISHFQAGYKNA